MEQEHPQVGISGEDGKDKNEKSDRQDGYEFGELVSSDIQRRINIDSRAGKCDYLIYSIQKSA